MRTRRHGEVEITFAQGRSAKKCVQGKWLRMAPASVLLTLLQPGSTAEKCIQSKEEGFMEEAAALEEEETGEHRDP